ncbi:MAG: Xaa-Pro peptidase family protein [Chlamydiota bacterium]
MTGSKSCFADRIKRLRAQMAQAKIDVLIVERSIDLCYLTGLTLSAGRLLVHQKRVVLAVDGRYRAIASKNSPFPVTSLTDHQMVKLFERAYWKEVRTVGFDSCAFSYADYLSWKRLLAMSKKKRRLKTTLKLKGLTAPVSQLRMIKDRREMRCIENSAQLLWAGFQMIRKQLRVGISEHEVAVAFEMYCKKRGATALSFDPIIAFGANSAFPHHKTGHRKLKRGDIVLIDIGLIVDGYASDMTRVVFFGAVAKRLRLLFDIVKKAQAAALAVCGPEVRGSTLDAAARQVMADAGLEKHYLHSLGHGIGLEVHEPPWLGIAYPEVVLKPGMVVSVEPGLYLPNLGGVRYEDTVIITKTGYRNLFPKAL